MMEMASLVGSEIRSMKTATRRAERGSSLVEQALVLTFLLAVLFGIIDFGRALYTYHFVSNAAREATRWASVRGTKSQLPGSPVGQPDVQAFVANVAGMGLDPTKITTTATWTPAPYDAGGCKGAVNSPGCLVEVQVKYQYTFMFPFLPASPFTMQSTSQMIISQ
jgi:Flp pilus assembly protein TadG